MTNHTNTTNPLNRTGYIQARIEHADRTAEAELVAKILDSSGLLNEHGERYYSTRLADLEIEIGRLAEQIAAYEAS